MGEKSTPMFFFGRESIDLFIITKINRNTWIELIIYSYLLEWTNERKTTTKNHFVRDSVAKLLMFTLFEEVGGKTPVSILVEFTVQIPRNDTFLHFNAFLCVFFLFLLLFFWLSIIWRKQISDGKTLDFFFKFEDKISMSTITISSF